MSIDAANVLVPCGYEIRRITIDTQSVTDVRIELRSDRGGASVVLRGVVDLQIHQRWLNWPFAMEFFDISDRQLEGLAVSVSDGQADQFRCMCAKVEVSTG